MALTETKEKEANHRVAMLEFKEKELIDKLKETSSK
jgi:hypothetical protein